MAAAEQLTLRVRHMAWLQSTPKPAGEKKSAGVPRLTSLQNKQNLGADQPDLDLPDPGPAAYLLDHLMSVGPLAKGEPLSFSEIAAWRDLTGVVLNPWESEMLKALSAAYGSEFYAAEDPARKSPKAAINP